MRHAPVPVQARADRWRQLTGHEVGVDELLDSPHLFVGSVESLTEKFLGLRERFGISSIMIDDIEGFAPIVERLAGH